MIGYRGCYRYISNPDLFGLELRALARVRERNPNLHLMIPFVRTRWELEKCLELVDASPLGASAACTVGDGRGALGGLLAARVRRHGRRRSVHRQQRPHPVDARRGPRLRPVRRAVRRVRRRRPRRDRPDHHHRPAPRHHRLAVRAGPVEPARLRRTPGADGHHVDLGHPDAAARTRRNVAAAERRLLLEAARGD